MICEKIIEVLNCQSPETYACGWDNVGLLVGSHLQDITNIYIALDATDDTILEARKANADMLLTHHPLIFEGLRNINAQDFIGRRVIQLIKHEICYYAMHTNFDIMGMAGLAADAIKLTATGVLDIKGYEQAGSVPYGIGKVGMLPTQMTLRECAEHVKQAFHLDTVKVFGQLDTKIHRAGIVPGAGKSLIDHALHAKAEVLITGDIGHHEGIDAVARNMCIIDAGHYGIEQIFVPYMKEYLERNLTGVAVHTQMSTQPFLYV
ncbi:Nif3-like dinuclear metal center hexameric protein [Lachnospiraceae bacterium ZAX-1]